LGQPLYRDEIERVQLEARNGLLLFDGVMKLVDESGSDLDLTPKTVENLHRLAIRGIYSCAGKFRKWPVTIKESLHKPPEEKYVEGLVKEMCDQANTNTEWPETKTAAYLLWRLNWIHPFGGGNGRTSRALSYLALCIRLGFKPPGKFTIPEQIVNARGRFQAALEDADAAFKASVTDVSKMESLLEEFLANQIAYLDEDPASKS
jgi:Fic family protein